MDARAGFSFDVGKETAGGVTPYQMKDERDTWYSKQRLKEFQDGVPFTGGVKLSSHAVGDNLKGYSAWSKPEFARQPIIRDSFFRSTGVWGKPLRHGRRDVKRAAARRARGRAAPGSPS